MTKRRMWAAVAAAFLLIPLGACTQRSASERVAGCYAFTWQSDSMPFNSPMSPDSVELTLAAVSGQGAAWQVRSAAADPDTVFIWVFDVWMPKSGWRWFTYFPERQWEVVGRDSLRIVLQNNFWTMQLDAESRDHEASGVGVIRPTYPDAPGRTRTASFVARRFPCIEK